MTAPDLDRKVRQLDNDVAAVYEILGRVEQGVTVNVQAIDSLRGLVMRQGGRIDAIDLKVETLDARVAAIDVKVESLDTKVTALDTKVTALDTKVTALDAKLDANVGVLGAKMDAILARLA